MSTDINPISPLKMKYINELRERSKDLLDAYPYSEHVVCDINLLRFVRGHIVRNNLISNKSFVCNRIVRYGGEC